MPTPRTIATALTRWFRTNARELPWRRDDADPYRVWVSEIMLQQTRVASVIPYYERWMNAYPTVQALADAPLDDVLGAWAGLGYYARARNLHRAARIVTREHGGALPRDEAALSALPGIGRYTLGAISSIAFGRKTPIVDGNVARVLGRLDGIDTRERSRETTTRLWARAAELVEASSDPSALNQSLMELGATICTPRSPVCELCPLRAHCVAYDTGSPEGFGGSPPRPQRRTESAVAMLARTRRGEVLLGRRPDRGLLGGLWEPPRVEPADLTRGRPLGHVRHVFTHLELTVHLFALTLRSRADAPALLPERYCASRWLRPEQVDEVPLSRLATKLLALGGIETASGRRHR